MRTHPPTDRFPEFPSFPNFSFRDPHPRFPRYTVVLVYAENRDFMSIARTLMELTRFGEAEAVHRMWQALRSGRAAVLTTHLERAELYAEQFTARGLRVELEPV